MDNVLIETDVLVIGGGGAGFRAAIGAREKGAEVLLVSKGPLARCGATPMAGADFTLDGRSMSEIDGLAGDPQDSPEKAFNDIVTQGCFLNNQKLVGQYLKRAPQCLRELIEWGIEIKASDERMIFTSGLGIMDALLKKARSMGVGFLEDVALLDLVVEDGRVAGAVGLDIRSGRFIRFACRAAVMASGGWHKAFWPNTGMRDLSGEGVAMAFRAGAALGNLEFITFCCNVFYDPPIWRGSLAPYLLTLLLGGRMTNRSGEDFLSKYDPYLVEKGTFTEWNKSFLSYAARREERAGQGLVHGGIGYSRGDVPWENVEFFASILFPNWKYKAIDLSEWRQMLEKNEVAEVGPAVEYFDGGIVVGDRFETTLPGLFAAGECTLGAFGANRVFAAITEMLVHGVDAGENAGAMALNESAPRPGTAAFESIEARALEVLGRSQGPRPAQVRRRVQEAAHQHLGPIRTGRELTVFLDFLQGIKENELPSLAPASDNRVYNKDWLDALELANMVQLLEMAARSALARTESRGVHFREDFPDTDNDGWLKESFIQPAEKWEVSHRPVTVTAMTPPAGKTPYLEFIKQMMQARSDTAGKH